MFEEKANAMFNNVAFICPKMPGMHEQMKRLYEAARLLRHVEGQAALASLFNTSSQRINNWESRGISDEGLLAAQEIVGCDAIWLRNGTGQMVKTAGKDQVSAMDVAMLVRQFGEFSPDERTAVLDFVRALARVSAGAEPRVDDQAKR